MFGGHAHHGVGHTGGDGDGGDFGVKQARRQRSRGTLLAGSAIFVHRITADAVTLGDLLGGLQHVPVNFRFFLGQPRVGQHVFVHFLLHTGNAFNATGHINIAFARNDALGCECNGLQARRTETVHCHPGGGDGQTGAQGGLAGNVGAGRALRVGAAHDDVVYLGALDAGAFDRVFNRMAAQRGTVGHVESALPAFGKRCAGGGNDYG